MSNEQKGPLGGGNEFHNSSNRVEEPSEYICQGPEIGTKGFEEAINRRPTAEVLRKVAKDVWVLRMTESDHKMIKSQFDSLIVEPNQELKPLR